MYGAKSLFLQLRRRIQDAVRRSKTVPSRPKRGAKGGGCLFARKLALKPCSIDGVLKIMQNGLPVRPLGFRPSIFDGPRNCYCATLQFSINFTAGLVSISCLMRVVHPLIDRATPLVFTRRSCLPSHCSCSALQVRCSCLGSVF